MDIQKLKKRLLKEEIRRQRKKSRYWRFLVPGILLGLVLLFGGLAFYLSHFDRMLEDDFAEAERLLAQGSFERAYDGFASIYQRHPTFHLAPQALFQSGEILNVYQRDYDEALLAYLLLEKDFPDNPLARRAQERVAEIYKNRLRDYRKAIVAYQKLLDGGEGQDQIQYQIADCYFRLEDYVQARGAFERLAESYPATPLLPEVRYRVGVALSLEGNQAGALRAFREVAERWPHSNYALEARFSQASVLEERDELLAAQQILEELRGRYPQTEALEKKLAQLRQRIALKKRAI